MRQSFSIDRVLGFGGFRSGADFLLQTIVPLLERRQIGQHQLGVDHFDVADRIDRSADVMNIAVFETADDLHDCVHFADVTEELIAEAFARARAFDQTGDIDELDRRRNDLLRMRNLREFCKARIGHGDDAEVGIDRAERIILRGRFVRAGDRVKERGFADIRQPNDSSA